MPQYWFTADTHFNHNNIRIHCHRPFSTVVEMNEALIANWNKLVKPDDFVYHLGDFCFRQGDKIFERLKGRKYLICGNHDSNHTKKMDWVWVKDSAMIKINEQYIYLHHYACRVWNRSFHGAWHLYGHSHGSLRPYGKSFDVGVDSHDFKPWAWSEIVVEMATLSKITNFV